MRGWEGKECLEGANRGRVYSFIRLASGIAVKLPFIFKPVYLELEVYTALWPFAWETSAIVRVAGQWIGQAVLAARPGGARVYVDLATY